MKLTKNENKKIIKIKKNENYKKKITKKMKITKT